MPKKTNIFWSFLSSVRLTIFLLTFIAMFSLVGTIIPQQDQAIQIAAHLPSPLFDLLNKIEVFDLFHSVFFFLLMGILSLNLLACSLKNFPASRRRFRCRLSPANDAEFRDIPEENILRVKNDRKTVTKIVSKIVESRFPKWRHTDIGDVSYLTAGEGGFSFWGVYAVHFSILLFLAGAITGSIFGMDGYVNIAEKESTNIIELSHGKGTISLPFTVRCDKFTLELHENGMPKIYRSDLSFIKNGKILKQGHVLVNHPLVFEGIRFYQESFGLVPEQSKAHLALFKNGKKIQDLDIGEGDSLKLPGREGRLSVLRIEENLMNMGPAIKLSVTSDRGVLDFWVFQRLNQLIKSNPAIEQNPKLNPGIFHPYRFAFTGIEKKFFTGLKISRDPGIPLVAVAAFMMVAGLITVLFFTPRQIWIRIDSADGFTRISIAGRSYKNAAGCKKEMQMLLSRLAKRLEELK